MLINALGEIKPLFSGDEIHISDVNDYKKCRRAWNWSSRLRNMLEPTRVYSPFFFGRAVHHCVEQLYAFDTPYETSLPEFIKSETAKYAAKKPIIEEDRNTIAENEELARGLLEHYEAWERRQRGGFSMQNLEFLSLEQEFAIPIYNPYTGELLQDCFYAGKWDGLVRRKDNGDIYIWEFKTAKAVAQRVKQLELDPQTSMYLNAARIAIGPQVKGMLYTIAAKRVPTKPRVLVSGFLTPAVKPNEQTVESYLKFIREHHPDMSDADISLHYGMTLLNLERAENSHFQRHIAYRTEHALTSAMWDMFITAQEMTNPKIAITYSPSYNCNTCLFRDPCIAMQNGDNYQTILDYDYQKRDLHSSLTPSDED